ncbi:MAG: hypothetical protein A2Z96_05895 [Spirochaetes bacterium GWB1_48_6]|nr:MAG: hypothetical protein A2Z96_05895 [Spirochaetes bacterium GWB1_48_6]
MRLKLINLCILLFIILTISVLVYIIISIVFIFLKYESFEIAIKSLSEESFTYKGGVVTIGMKYFQGIVFGVVLLIGLIRLLKRKE